MKQNAKNQIKDKIYQAGDKGWLAFNRWRKENFTQSSKLIYWVALILVSIEVASRIGRIIRPQWLGYCIVVSVCLLLGVIIKYIIVWIMTLLAKVIFKENRLDELLSMLMIIGVIVSGISYFAFRIGRLPVVLIGIIIGCLLTLYLKSLWSLIIGKLWTRFNLGVVLAGSMLLGATFLFLNSKGFEDKYINIYRKLETGDYTLSKEEQESFKSATQGGMYTVLEAVYDIADAPLISGTVNLKSYAQNKGMAGYIKRKYQGYDLDQVPLRGIIWYPKEGNQCETLFIVHGNHDYKEESYLGYEYLGRYLASYGYVVVSIDENACNLLTNESDARAILLLENIAQIRKYNQMPGSLLYNKIDETRLAIAGHSRGGEAVSIAYLFNHQSVHPNNGNIKLDYHFDIRSIIAIAPTVDQYKPTKKSVVLEDVNYMIIHGANDQDLYQFGGIKQYKNIHYSGEKNNIKTALYCAGCNHGQFNSRWGLYDRTGFYHRVLNVKNLLSEEAQQEIADIFIKIFLDCTLREDTTHLRLLEDYRAYMDYLPETLYVQSYQTSHFKALCQFEEDMSLETGTMEGVEIEVVGGDIWTEGLYPAEAAQGNSAMYLQWNNGNVPWVNLSLQKLNMNNRILQMDLMNLEEGFEAEDAALLEAQIIVEDIKGQQAQVSLSDYGTVYPAFLVRLNKLQYLLGKVEYKHQFQTVSIPMEAFKEANSQLDLSQITRLKLIFNGASGTIAIDEIGY